VVAYLNPSQVSWIGAGVDSLSTGPGKTVENHKNTLVLYYYK
jgi:hypothetical protein